MLGLCPPSLPNTLPSAPGSPFPLMILTLVLVNLGNPIGWIEHAGLPEDPEDSGKSSSYAANITARIAWRAIR